MMFNANLREIRKEKEMTQQTLADIMNVSVDTIRRWELGKRKPNYEDILNLSDVFKVPMDVFFGRRTPNYSHHLETSAIIKKFLGSDELTGVDKIILSATLTKIAIEQTQGLTSSDYTVLQILIDRVNEALREKGARLSDSQQIV